MGLKKRALILGINGQIGSYLCEILQEKGYEVHGIVRKLPAKLVKYVKYTVCDLEDIPLLKGIIRNISPDEIYNMAAQSDAVISMANPEHTMWINCNIVVALCELAKELGAKLFQASSVELYKGLPPSLNSLDRYVDETTLEFYPKNPYAFAKLAAHWSVRYYREQYGCYMVNGIIANAESPRRDIKYVTRKITTGVQQALVDPNYVMKIGNLDARRDWIHAYDVAMAAWMSLQQKQHGDYMIGLGETHSVRKFLELSFHQAGISLKWEGDRDSVDEVGVDARTGRCLVKIDPALFRTYEGKCSATICGNNTKLKSIGWTPKYNLKGIISELLNT